MPDQLKELESKRKSLFDQLLSVGDLRRGTISVNYRKCGKKNCACASPDHPGHGPQILWNVTVNGKSYSRNLKTAPELEKFAVETDNYRTFKDICDQIIQINEKICELRPVPELKDKNEAEKLKKKLQRRFMKKSKTK